ncbi:MAG: hypothetical protein KKH71_00100 [Gammaproteobacteria bacterium]|nr:hypothetical protein [Gammaproteobacteria bacterium]MBU1479808.1 hypothetical protein [Gammaproteobacteria bacterium]MBU1999498.1 hypothetical protein [Gammaproteobacteria bacterium]
MLLGEGGDDVLSGGAGNDTLIGGAGNDKYLFALGDGADTINNYDTSATNKDILAFGAGIDSAKVNATRSDDDLILQVNGTEDQVTIKSYFANGGSSEYSLSSILFEDGTDWSIEDVTGLLPTLAAETSSVSSDVTDNVPIDLSLNLLIQAYSAFDGDDDAEVGKYSKDRYITLPIVEEY